MNHLRKREERDTAGQHPKIGGDSLPETEREIFFPELKNEKHLEKGEETI